ncbi:MAG: hypothetical protein JSS43_25500 [Proteobacteria bacterium]|nr:hypothetical protein [Pseudomonadota bacterium]
MSSTTGQDAFQATKDAVGSAAERVRAAAPSAYDAATRGTQYVGGTVSEYPLVSLLAAAGLAFLLGRLGRGSDDNGSDWYNRAESLRQQLSSLSSNLPDTTSSVRRRGRDATDYASQTASEAGDYLRQSASRAGDYLRQNAGVASGYVAQGVRDYPTSTLMGVAAAGAIVGYLLRGRS